MRNVVKSALLLSGLLLGCSEGAREDDQASGRIAHLVASTDDVHAVTLGWDVEGSVQRFTIYRNGEVLAEVGGDERSFVDENAGPGTIPAPILQASRGSFEEVVRLSWSEPVPAPGAAASYQVTAHFGNGSRHTSKIVTGSRAAPSLLGFELRRDGGRLAEVDAATTTWDDEGARSARLGAPSGVRAQGLEEGIRLSWRPAA